MTDPQSLTDLGTKAGLCICRMNKGHPVLGWSSCWYLSSGEGIVGETPIPLVTLKVLRPQSSTLGEYG